jgi:t-SNARE complex subunit (syntaxin)
MGIDRLKDLKNSKDQVEIDIDDDANEEEDNPTKGFGVAGTEVGSMQEFLKIIEIVKKNIVNIREGTKEIVEINQKFILATTEKQEETASEGLSQIIINGNKNAKSAQGLLKDLNKEILELEKKNSLKPGDLRIRKNLVQTITKKYIDVLKEYQNVQNKSKELKKKRAVKRVQQVKPDATPEEIDAVIKTGGDINIYSFDPSLFIFIANIPVTLFFPIYVDCFVMSTTLTD